MQTASGRNPVEKKADIQSYLSAKLAGVLGPGDQPTVETISDILASSEISSDKLSDVKTIAEGVAGPGTSGDTIKEYLKAMSNPDLRKERGAVSRLDAKISAAYRSTPGFTKATREAVTSGELNAGTIQSIKNLRQNLNVELGRKGSGAKAVKSVGEYATDDQVKAVLRAIDTADVGSEIKLGSTVKDDNEGETIVRGLSPTQVEAILRKIESGYDKAVNPHNASPEEEEI